MVDPEVGEDEWGLSELPWRLSIMVGTIVVKLPAWQLMEERTLYVVSGQKVTGWVSWRGEQRESERSARRAPRSVDSEVRGVWPRLVVGGYNEGERYSFVEYDRLAIRNPSPSPSPRFCVGERHRVVRSSLWVAT